MKNLNRRKLLQTGMALSVPFGSMSLINNSQQSTDRKVNNGGSAADDNAAKPNQDKKEKTIQIQYLEIVTPEVDALCKQYSADTWNQVWQTDRKFW